MSNQPDLAERDQVTLSVLPDSGPAQPIRTWTRYALNNHVLKPTAGWEFELGGKTIDRALIDTIRPGTKIQLAVNGKPQCTGLVDELAVDADRHTGTVLHVSGRDMLGQAVDGNADPQVRFSRGMSLQQVLEGVFVKQFGFSSVVGDASTDIGVLTGIEPKRTKTGKPRLKDPLQQVKPYSHDGGWAFADRLARMHGLLLWCSADGKSVIADQPNYEGDPIYTLRRRTNEQAIHNNVIRGTVRLNMSDQPTHIVCDGFGGGGEFGHSRLRCVIGNPVFSANNGPLVDRYPDATFLETDFTILSPSPIVAVSPRVLFIHDEDARTQSELEQFARRQLALKMHRALVATYEVAGHTQNGAPWAVNTLVNVQDDIGGLNEPMYILSRTFTKDKHSGARTHLELIRKGALEITS